MEKVTIYYGIFNGGDGSAGIQWYLTEKEADNAERDQSEGWGEPCNGSVETFIGSDIYKKAVINSK